MNNPRMHRRFPFSCIVSVFCCTASTLCFCAGPVQWEDASGGNGHWYELVRVSTLRTWSQAKLIAKTRTLEVDGSQLCGYLATLTSAEENAFVRSEVVVDLPSEPVWIGGFVDPDTYAWTWVNPEEGWYFTAWERSTGEPNEIGTEAVLSLHDHAIKGGWADYPPGALSHYLLVEYGEPEAKSFAFELSSNGHFYELKQTCQLSWDSARRGARHCTLAGREGEEWNAHLVTFSGERDACEEEYYFVLYRVCSNVPLFDSDNWHGPRRGPWIGAYETEGNTWHWVIDSEDWNCAFWNGPYHCDDPNNRSDDAAILYVHSGRDGGLNVWELGWCYQPRGSGSQWYIVEYEPPASFIRGDAAQDGTVTLADALFVARYLFAGGPSPQCLDSADVNDDGRVSVVDPLYLLYYLFMGTAQPPPPFGPGGCGPDPTPDGLTCISYRGCGR